MSRLVGYRDMTADEVIQCGYDAMALVRLCAIAAEAIIHEGAAKDRNVLAGSIESALLLANELIAVLHDTVEMHEQVRQKA